MNSTLEVIFGLLGGLAVFIFGMNMMSDCLQKAAGEKMKRILALLTKNPILGVLAGALTTAVLQSSSATTVMAIGFVSAGLMNLPQAISIILGANIGTHTLFGIVCQCRKKRQFIVQNRRKHFGLCFRNDSRRKH